ncbi:MULTISPECIES: hypothetical protein [unclassified Saccharothrix]|uniref:hypothetical protein n=1 Tax=unclassified Saccharothrix TaxID=2593673 RepID=UPI00307ED812
MSEAEECVHELPAGMCHLCKAPPPGVLKQGWRTKVGRAYHNDRDCDLLRKGHRYAERRGNEVHDAVPVRWVDVNPGELQPCEHCCTPEWLRRHDRAPGGSRAERGSPAAAERGSRPSAAAERGSRPSAAAERGLRPPMSIVPRGTDSAVAVAGGKPCLVRVGGEWVPGTLVWEPKARADGLWWASVTHRAHGREVTEIRSQHDVRKR